MLVSITLLLILCTLKIAAEDERGWGKVVKMDYYRKGRVAVRDAEYLARRIRDIFDDPVKLYVKLEHLEDYLTHQYPDLKVQIHPRMKDCADEWCQYWVAYEMLFENRNFLYLTVMGAQK